MTITPEGKTQVLSFLALPTKNKDKRCTYIKFTHWGDSDLRDLFHVVLNGLIAVPKAALIMLQWVHEVMNSTYTLEIKGMLKMASGRHFSILHAETGQFENFKVEGMASRMEVQGLFMWDLWEELLTTNKIAEKERLQYLIR